MSCYLSDSGVSKAAFQLVVELTPFKEWSSWVTYETADASAKQLSKMLPDHDVTLQTMARIKARYRNGERVLVNNYNKFYFLTDVELASTLIKDSVTAELI